ncbi:hypothetical protein A5773_02260 [Mycobacterium sp. 852014-52450_SCH5900713]|nr:hypothetical protein A5773_02260 [Mycobacterium sp. 852014-52450_SCH5900713]
MNWRVAFCEISLLGTNSLMTRADAPAPKGTQALIRGGPPRREDLVVVSQDCPGTPEELERRAETLDDREIAGTERGSQDPLIVRAAVCWWPHLPPQQVC